ncbi:MAG: hypothetical protein QOF43_2095 [Gaiellaceae bacterium]|nr:hypothetical protein [Gaiellaceae bacterium]
MRSVAVLCLAGAVPAVVGGLVFSAVHGDTVTRAIAYGFWAAAALLLLAMLLSTSKPVWRRTTLPVPEGWAFVSAAFVLTAVGAAIDTAGAL